MKFDASAVSVESKKPRDGQVLEHRKPPGVWPTGWSRHDRQYMLRRELSQAPQEDEPLLRALHEAMALRNTDTQVPASLGRHPREAIRDADRARAAGQEVALRL